MIRFYIVINFETKERYKELESIVKEIEKDYPEYKFNIALDTDFILI